MSFSVGFPGFDAQKFEKMASEYQYNFTEELNSYSNNTSVELKSLEIVQTSHMNLENIVKLTLEVPIAFVGVAGNLLVLAVILSQGKRKQPSDVCLLNLAIADLGMLLSTYPMAAIREKPPYRWPLGEFTCRYLYPLPEIFYGASVWCIVSIAFRRYYNVVKSHGALSKAKEFQRARSNVACVWVISFVIFCLPVYFVVEYREVPNGAAWCGPVWPSWNHNLIAIAYIALLTFFSYVMPLSIIAFAYFVTSRALKQTSTLVKAMNSETNKPNRIAYLCIVKSARLQRNKRAQRILTPLVLVFAITMFPLSVLRLVVVVWPAFTTEKMYANILYIIIVFAILNSSANPIIYTLVSRNFRKGVQNIYKSHSR